MPSTNVSAATSAMRLVMSSSWMIVRGGRRTLAFRLFVVLAGEELFLFELLADLVRRLRVERLHAFELVGRQRWQMPDEVDEAPGRVLEFRGAVAPRRHPGESYALLDDMEKLAVGQVLRHPGAHVRRLGKKGAPDVRLPA